MTYIVKDECIKCKLTDCVEVCPVDCFYEGENMLVINPDECIDCGVCEPECPIDAIKADTDESVNDMEKWVLLNKKFSAIWPNISKKKDPMENHEKYKNIKDKYDKHFSEKPGKQINMPKKKKAKKAKKIKVVKKIKIKNKSKINLKLTDKKK